MKRIISLMLVMLMLVGMVPAYAAGTGTVKGKAASVNAGAFKGVTHKLKPGVEMVKASDFKTIKNKMEGGDLDKSDLPTAIKSKFSKLDKGALSEKKIFVSDDWSDTIAIEKSAKEENGDRLIIGNPSFLDVFEDINIPDQTVYLTPGNLTTLEKGMSITPRKLPSTISSSTTTKSSSTPPPPSAGTSSSYSSEVTSYGFTFKFDNAAFSKKVGGVDVTVSLSGSLDLEAPHVEGKYSRFDGYKLVLKAGETINLSAKTNIDIKEDIKIPIGTPFMIEAGVGRAYIGLFIVLRMDGSIMLSFDLHQQFSVTAGVKGGTWFYVPTSIKKVFDCKKEFNTNAVFVGEVNGIMGIAPIVSLKFAGMDVLYLEVLLGVKAHVKITGDDRNVNAGVSFKVSGEVLNHDFTLVNYYLELYDYKERNTGKFKIKIEDACAYRGLIQGTVEYPDKFGDYKPYTGKLSIRVSDNTGKKTEYHNIALNNGRFSFNTLLKKNNKVEAKVMNQNIAYCTPAEVTFPFSQIVVDTADYFNKVIEGNVATKAKNVKGAANEAVQELAYTGPVDVKIWKLGEYSYSKIVNAVDGKFKVDSKTAADFINKMTPESYVNVAIAKNGFELKDQMNETDGLIIYPFVYAIEKDGQGNAGSKPVSYTSKGMKFYVANKRAEDYPNNTPSGNIMMKMSVAFPHVKPGVEFDITSDKTVADDDLYEQNNVTSPDEYNRIYMIYKSAPLEKVTNKKGIAVAAVENVSLGFGGRSQTGTGEDSGVGAAVDMSNATLAGQSELSAFEIPDNLSVSGEPLNDYFENYDLTHYSYSYDYLPYGRYKNKQGYPFSFIINGSTCILEQLEKDDIADKAEGIEHDVDINVDLGNKGIKGIPGGVIDNIDLNINRGNIDNSFLHFRCHAAE